MDGTWAWPMVNAPPSFCLFPGLAPAHARHLWAPTQAVSDKSYRQMPFKAFFEGHCPLTSRSAWGAHETTEAYA